jgi:ATP synthase protein I
MAGCIIFCFFIGFYLDKWLGTKGLFIVIFILLGIIGGGVTVYRQILGITKYTEKDHHNP